MVVEYILSNNHNYQNAENVLQKYPKIAMVAEHQETSTHLLNCELKTRVEHQPQTF